MSDQRPAWEGYLRPLEQDAEWRGSVLALVESLGVCTDCGAVVPKETAEYHRRYHERNDVAWGRLKRALLKLAMLVGHRSALELELARGVPPRKEQQDERRG